MTSKKNFTFCALEFFEQTVIVISIIKFWRDYFGKS